MIEGIVQTEEGGMCRVCPDARLLDCGSVIGLGGKWATQ